MAFVFNPFTGTLDQKLVVEGTSSEIAGNLVLNDNYISNDGGDEGIRITDAGLVGIGVTDPDSSLELMSTGNILKLSRDADDYLLFTQQDNGDSLMELSGGMQIRMDNGKDFVVYENSSGGHAGSNQARFAIVNSGSHTTLKLNAVANGDDKFTIEIQDEGATTISTVDVDTAVGHLTLDADGDIILDCHTGKDILIQENGGTYTPASDAHVATKKYVDDNAAGATALNGLSDVSYSSGDLTITSLDTITYVNSSDAILKVATTGGGTDGRDLTIEAGSAPTGSANQSGGDLILKSGGGDGTGTSIMQFQTKVNGTDAVDTRMQITTDGTILVNDKIIFTQTDGNEYIDSLNDGYLDLDATTAIRLKADVELPAYIGLTFGDAGEKIEGDGTDLVISSSNILTVDTASAQYFDSGAGLFFFMDDGDDTERFRIRVIGGQGSTTFSTFSDDATGHLNIKADGHVEFDGCAVGFDQEEETFSGDDLLASGSGTGGTHDTHIDFRIGNKIYLEITATMNDMNLIFPAVSGNFMLIVDYDGDWAIDSWKAWESDLSAATAANVLWPGGTEPATTNNGKDIFSFYWDAENQICYGVASLDFQAGD